MLCNYRFIVLISSVEKIGQMCKHIYAPSIFRKMIEYETLSEEEKNVIINKELDEVFNNLADLCIFLTISIHIIPYTFIYIYTYTYTYTFIYIYIIYIF